jgi:hypothetical protein
MSKYLIEVFKPEEGNGFNAMGIEVQDGDVVDSMLYSGDFCIGNGPTPEVAIKNLVEDMNQHGFLKGAF